MSGVPTIELAGGVSMPRLIYGTAWKQDATADCVAAALSQGFRGIDTACQPRHYHEPGVGDGLARVAADVPRAAVYLQTKFSPPSAQDPDRLPYALDAPVAEQVAQSFSVSLTNLGTDYLDGLILHSPLATAKLTLEAWRALEVIARAGGTRLLGVSNFYSEAQLAALWDAAQVKPAIVQNRFYRTSGYDRGIRDFCRAHDMVYQSFWTLTANPDLLAAPALTQIAGEYGLTPEQTLFRYLTQQGVVPLTGTTSTGHMREDLAIFDVELDQAELDAVSGLLD